MTSLVMRRLKEKLKLVPLVRRTISQGMVKLEQVQVICPACGQQIEAVAVDGRVKGYCAVAKQDVDFPIETQLETRIKHSVIAKKLWQDPEFRARQIASHTGRHHTAEHRAKISAALKRQYNIKRGGIKSNG